MVIRVLNTTAVRFKFKATAKHTLAQHTALTMSSSSVSLKVMKWFTWSAYVKLSTEYFGLTHEQASARWRRLRETKCTRLVPLTDIDETQSASSSLGK